MSNIHCARAFWRRGDEVSRHADYAAAFAALGAKIAAGAA